MRLTTFQTVTLAALLVAVAAAPSWAQQRPPGGRSFEQAAARAERARAANRVEEAAALYREALALRPGWAEGWFYLGTLLYERDEFAGAARAFSQATALRPEVGTAWVMLGLCEFRLNRHAAALAHIRRGRQLGVGDDPQLRRVMLYHEGLLLLGEGEFVRAQETLGLLAQEGAAGGDVLHALGLSVLRARFSDLLAGDPARRELVRRAGQAESLAARKMFEEARAAYGRLAQDFPRTPGVQYAYGRFLLADKQDEQAVEAFKREIENTPGHLLARLMIAEAELSARDYEGGLPYAEEAVKLNPKLPLGRYLLGALLLGANQTARAVAELEAARAGQPDEPKIYYVLARAYERAGRRRDAERARADFERLNKQAGGDAGAGGARPPPGH